jgi:septin family protein
LYVIDLLLSHFAAIHENGIRLDLTVTDTPGYGDRIDNTNWYSEKFPFFV